MTKINFYRLTYYRHEAELTLKELADLADVGYATIKNINSGKSCYHSTAQRIADALGVTVEDLTKKYEPRKRK